MARRAADPGRGPGSVRVSRACFGTLSNGSDVRLLASPADMTMTGAMTGALEAFFYAAWKGVGQRREPYFALIPLEDDLSWWGLVRVTRHGRGAAGEVVAAWCALMDERTLDTIAWATHRMLASGAFPPAAAPPAAGTKLAPETVTLVQGRPEAIARFDPAFEQVLAATGDFRKPAAILVERPFDASVTPLSAEGALFGLWDALHGDRAGLSWTTWAGVEAQGFSPRERPFDVVFAEDVAPAARPGRLNLRLGKDPSGDAASPAPRHRRAWNALRAGTAAAPSPADPPAAVASAPDDGRALAQLIYERSPADFAAGSNLSIFGRLAELGVDPSKQAPVFLTVYRTALPALLERVVEAAGDAQIAAHDVDCYAAEVVAKLPDDPSAAVEAARIAAGAGIMARLGDAGVMGVGPGLFDDPAAMRLAVNQLNVADPRMVAWKSWIAVAEAGIDKGTELAKAVAARAWNRPEHRMAAGGLIGRIVKREGLAAVLPLLHPEWAPRDGEADLFHVICRLRGEDRSRPRQALLNQFRLVEAGEALRRRA